MPVTSHLNKAQTPSQPTETQELKELISKQVKQFVETRENEGADSEDTELDTRSVFDIFLFQRSVFDVSSVPIGDDSGESPISKRLIIYSGVDDAKKKLKTTTEVEFLSCALKHTSSLTYSRLYSRLHLKDHRRAEAHGPL